MDFETFLSIVMLIGLVVSWTVYRLSYKISYASNRRKRYVQPPRKSNDRRVGGVRHG